MKGVVYGVVFEVMDGLEVVHSLHSTMEKALAMSDILNACNEEGDEYYVTSYPIDNGGCV